MRSTQRADESFLKELAESAKSRVKRGYYSIEAQRVVTRRSLVGALRSSKNTPIIAEVKFRSPAEGEFALAKDVRTIARAYESGGAAGISVLTEPDHFEGKLDYLPIVKAAVALPVLMKDIVVDEAQVEAGYRVGADAVLLIAGVFLAGHSEETLAGMLHQVHARGLEALVEVHDEEEYVEALSSEADIVGINNRDLRTLQVSIETSEKLLAGRRHTKPVICESGISTAEHVSRLKKLGANGFLIGTALMRSSDPEAALKRLAAAR